VLRHQLNVLRRKSVMRPTFGSIDRLIFAGLYGLAPNVLSALAIVRPETTRRCRKLAGCGERRLKIAIGIGRGPGSLFLHPHARAPPVPGLGLSRTAAAARRTPMTLMDFASVVFPPIRKIQHCQWSLWRLKTARGIANGHIVSAGSCRVILGGLTRP
jgi:hypothetical protein